MNPGSQRSSLTVIPVVADAAPSVAAPGVPQRPAPAAPVGTGEARLLTGWGRTAPSLGRVVRPEDADALTELLAARGGSTGAQPGGGADHAGHDQPGSGLIARGLGRSYGDAAQSAGGVVVDTACFDSIGSVEPETGIVEVGSGVSLDELIARSLPLGWFVPVSPGTRWVTVGGAIAADVHGKNHHRDGAFCSHVTSLTLATPTGTRVVGPDTDGELFWATAGGMGLTGVITGATLQLTRVETSWMVVDTERFGVLDDLMAAMEASDAAYRYSVAWVDFSPRRRGFGRAVLSRGDHAPAGALGPNRIDRAVEVPHAPRLRVPVVAPRWLVNPATVRAFNEVIFRRPPRRQTGGLQPLASFFHPLDVVADWNRLYGPAGFVQYQFVVGPAHGEAVHRAAAMLQAAGVSCSLAVLKRFGPADPGPLSFPMEGWTLALDFAAGQDRLPALLDQLDELVASVGGRVYLAKDARLSPELLAVMYPALGKWAEVRRRVDPDRLLGSDLSRRLGLSGVRGE